jgi:hypothetical protein
MGDSPDALLNYLDKCGLSVVLGDEPNTLLLRGPKAEKTPAVLAALKKYKADIIKRLTPGKPAAVPEKSSPVTAEIEGTCDLCRATICFPAAGQGVLCERTQCPQTRLGTDPRAENPSVWKFSPRGGST